MLSLHRLSPRSAVANTLKAQPLFLQTRRCCGWGAADGMRSAVEHVQLIVEWQHFGAHAERGRYLQHRIQRLAWRRVHCLQICAEEE